MRSSLISVPLVLLAACATPRPAPVEVTQPPPATTPEFFVPVPTYHYLPSPTSAAEREVLGRLEQELTLLQRLAREAQAQRNPAARSQFNYHALMRDLDRIRHGIRDHLQAPDLAPRAFQPIRGDYRVVGP